MGNRKIYQIQIALRDFKPKIWRRVLVQPDMVLADFHDVIQTSMGWDDEHLHQFIKGNTIYKPDMELDFGFRYEFKDYQKTRISDLLKKEKDKVMYEYDFGDGWQHDIILERILPYDENIKYPLCIKGKNACPPEDCGGVWAYYDMLQVLSDPKDERY